MPSPAISKHWLLAMSLLVILPLTGCSSGTDKPGSVELLSVNPKSGSELTVGEKVEISALVEYSMGGARGEMELLVETVAGKPVGTGRGHTIAGRGSGISTLRKEITVPETAGLRVFAVMRPDPPPGDPAAVQVALYSVVPVTPVIDEWDAADAAVRRLPPGAFPELPYGVKKELERRQCTVPQTFISTQPHNVISGEFARKGQNDWAVLCSTGRMSGLIVFWGGSGKDVFAFPAGPDKNYLQGTGEGIGYSCAISAVGKDYILERHEWYGGPQPPDITHEGINVAFVEKASSVLYFDKGEWLSLQGAD